MRLVFLLTYEICLYCRIALFGYHTKADTDRRCTLLWKSLRLSFCNAVLCTMSFTDLHLAFCAGFLLLDHVRALALVAYNTGMRKDELLNLKWSDVNLAEGFNRLHIADLLIPSDLVLDEADISCGWKSERCCKAW